MDPRFENNDPDQKLNVESLKKNYSFLKDMISDRSKSLKKHKKRIEK